MGWFNKPHVCGVENHGFEPRYDEIMPEAESRKIEIRSASPVDRVVGALKNKIYVLDICRYCGKTIERQADKP